MNTYQKNILPHPEFYIAEFTKKKGSSYLLFIHGGPGLNCGALEYFIEHDQLFSSLNYNILVYDQRNCGRSKKFSTPVTHSDNVSDLEKIYNHLKHSLDLKIMGFIGHSYGAKLLFDYYKEYSNTLPGIFISTANNILTPRLNNLLLDLNYLKRINPSYYQQILTEMAQLNLEKIWALTEKLAPIFHENDERPYFYWTNLNTYQKMKEAQENINLPINSATFMSVREDLYTDKNNFSVDIQNLNTPYLWINGFHDFIMNGATHFAHSIKNIICFNQSSHYPHLEENQHFCELINAFIENN